MWTQLRLLTSAVSFFSLVLSYLCLFFHFSLYSKLKESSAETFVELVKKSKDLGLWLFAPLITLESISVFLTIYTDPDESSSDYPLIAGTILLWPISFIIIRRILNKLQLKKHEALINELIIWNWIRIFVFGAKFFFVAMGIIDNLTLQR